MDIATSSSKKKKKTGDKKVKTAEKKRREAKSKTFQADTLPMCSPNLQIEVDSKRSCSLWRALQACNGSVFVHLSMEQSRKAKQKQ